jgi:hypothetical protein
MAQETHEKKLQYEELLRCYELHVSRHWPALNRKLLLNTMLKETPRVSLNGRQFADSALTDEFREMLHHHYLPFLSRFFDWVFCAGFALVRLTNLPGGGKSFNTLDIEAIGVAYDVFVSTDHFTNERKFRVVRKVDRRGMPIAPKTDHKVFAISNLGHDPTWDGQIRSMARPLLNIVDYNAFTLNLGLIADYNLSMPTVITTAKDVSTAIDQMPESQIAFYAEYDAKRTPNEGAYRRNPEERGSARRHVSVARPEPDIDISKPLKVRNQLKDNMMNLPPGREIAQQPLPQRRTDFVGVQSWFEHAVSATYGVPRELIAKDVSLRTAASADLIRDQMRDTLSYWIRLFSHTLTVMHNAAYGESERNWWAGRIEEKMTADELEAAVNKATSWEITLPMPPNADSEFIHYLYAMGIVTYEEAHDHLRAAAGLAPTKAGKPPTFNAETPIVLPEPPSRN